MRWLVVIAAMLYASACIGTSPEEAARAALGGEGRGGGEDDDDGDPEHRPGQPCLTCHGADYSPGEDVFVVAGTVYLRASDRDGLQGAAVEMTDAEGHQFTAITNRTGNFMVQVKSKLSAPRQRDHGKVQIPWEPVFPLEISVSHADVAEAQEMKSYAWRDGSCAGCHIGAEDGADSVARVWLIEEGN